MRDFFLSKTCPATASLWRESFNPIGGVAFGPTFVSPRPQKERYASLRSVRSDHAFEGGTSKSPRRVPSKCVPVLQRLERWYQCLAPSHRRNSCPVESQNGMMARS